MLAQPDVWPERIRPLRRVEYDAIVERGFLADSRVELLRGTLVEMTPQGPLHANVVRRLAERLFAAAEGRVHVRVQSPLALSDDSEPEPDIAVVPAADYDRHHPTEALFVVEVADTSLQKDRGIKAALYAEAGIPEFWIVNLTEHVVDVHRRPVDGQYLERRQVDRQGSVAPAAFPRLQIAVADLLP